MSLAKAELVADIIRDAGGEITGRTRLQKTAYLLEATGLGSGFHFAYKRYGPYSEDVASSASVGTLFGNLKEVKKNADWGGIYSIYSVENHTESNACPARRSLVRCAANANPVALELAATAVFLSKEGYDDPWQETKRRKPERATSGHLKQANKLLSNLKKIDLPEPLPGNV